MPVELTQWRARVGLFNNQVQKGHSIGRISNRRDLIFNGLNLYLYFLPAIADVHPNLIHVCGMASAVISHSFVAVSGNG
jgi:hypothetical protein